MPLGPGVRWIGGTIRMRAVAVTAQPTFASGNPAPIPNPTYWLDSVNDAVRQYDVAADGQTFVGVILAGSAKSDDPGAPTNQEIQVVLNWFTELQQRVPTR